jgi:hypothetical protein
MVILRGKERILFGQGLTSGFKLVDFSGSDLEERYLIE